jgi:hypothetical protein
MKMILTLVSFFLGSLAFASNTVTKVNVPQNIQSEINDQIYELTSFEIEEDGYTYTMSAHEINQDDYVAADIVKNADGSTTYYIPYDVGMGNDVDESVIYSVGCTATVSVSEKGMWQTPIVECEDSQQYPD